MSLYDLVVRPNPGGAMLFATLGLSPAVVPRLRDVWINAELTEVTVFTRTGGGNRSEYEGENAGLRTFPGFLRDSDWALDATYAEWVFAVDPDKSAILKRDIEARSAEDQEVIRALITKDATTKWTEMMGSLKPDDSHEFG